MSTSSDQAELKPVEVPLLLKREPAILFGMTGRQALIVACGLAVGFSLWQSFAFFQTLPGIILLVCLCIVPATLVAFLKIGTRPLEQWFLIMPAWMLMPERLSLRLLLRTFVKVRSISDGIVALDLGGRRQLEYQAILCVESKDFNLLSGYEQSVIIESFGKMLNGLSYPVTIHIRSLPYIPTVLSSTVIPAHLARQLQLTYTHYLSFLSQLVREKRPVHVSYYMTVPASENQPFERAKGQIKNRMHELSHQLARAGLSCRPLSSTELFLFYGQSFLLQSRERTAFVSADVLLDAGQLPAVLAPDEMSIAASWLGVQGRRGESQYLVCLALEHLPRKVQPGWLHRVIDMNEPYVDISLHISPHESDIVATKLRRRAVMLGGALLAAQQGSESGGGNTITRYALKDVERVRDQLIRKDAHLYSVTLFFTIRGMSRDELNERVSRVQLALRSLDFQTTPLHFQQHLGYFSSLGYGQNMLPYYGHLLTTDAAASFYPFSHVSVMDEGVLLGTTNGNIVSFDPYGFDKLNANLAVLGVPGSGKSFFLKAVLSRLAPDVGISIIDVEDEYKRFAEAVGGQRVILTADSLHINPFEIHKSSIVQENKEHTFREKVTMLLGFFALLLGENGTLTQRESAVVHSSIMHTYAAAGITIDPATHTMPAPSVHDFAVCLKKEEPTSDLSLRLASYIHLFPRRTHIPDTQHVVYSLKELPDSLQPVATYLITEKLWNELQEGRKAGETPPRRLVIVDEAWFLSKFPAGATLLNEFARRVRKYGGGLWIGTQQLADVLSSESGKNLLALCETKMLFRQDVSSIDVVRDTLHLSEAQVHYLRTARRGEALYMTSKETLAVEIVASEYETKMAVTTQRGSQKI